MAALWVYQHPAEGSAYAYDLTPWWNTWRRSERAQGGYWDGELTVTGTRAFLWSMYHNLIGKRVIENNFGLTCWEGEVYELTLYIDGVAHRTTLDTDVWHNDVRVDYTYPRVEDTEQGNLAYDPGILTSTFQDDAQDFSDWETAAPGTAIYQCVITNDDGTTVQFYCGDAQTVTNPNDAITTYLDVALTTQGWNGETLLKTPASYEINHIENAGASRSTGWAETTESSDMFGEAEFVDVRGEMMPADAEAIRDTRLTRYAYPRSSPVNGITSDAARALEPPRLEIVCAGYVYSMNRRHMNADVMAANVSAQVTVLVDGSADAAEFVTAGQIDANSSVTPEILCSEMPQRLWDLCEELTAMGDGTARWISGVGEGRELYYRAAQTSVTHYWRDNRLLNSALQPVHPALIQPDIIVQLGMPFGITPSGGGDADNPRQFYVEQCEFIAPRSYRLIADDGSEWEGAY